MMGASEATYTSPALKSVCAEREKKNINNMISNYSITVRIVSAMYVCTAYFYVPGYKKARHRKKGRLTTNEQVRCSRIVAQARKIFFVSYAWNNITPQAVFRNMKRHVVNDEARTNHSDWPNNPTEAGPPISANTFMSENPPEMAPKPRPDTEMINGFQ